MALVASIARDPDRWRGTSVGTSNSSQMLGFFGDLFRGRLTRRELFERGAQFGLAAAAGGAMLEAGGNGPAAAGGAHGRVLQSARQEGKPGGTINIGVRRDFSILDPHVTSAVSDGIFMMAVFDRLIERAQDGTLYPGLATEWSVSEDGLTWNIKLRQDVKFHDGTPFNADAVKINFDRMVDPATKSEYAIFELGPYAGTDVVDEYTVNVRMTRVFGALPVGLSTYGMGMLSPAAIAQYGQEIGSHPVGTGP